MHRTFIWYKNVVGRLFRFVTKHKFDGQTDGQTDFDSNRVIEGSYMHGKIHVNLSKSKWLVK